MVMSENKKASRNTSLTMLFSVSCVSSFCLADMLLLTSEQHTQLAKQQSYCYILITVYWKYY